MTKTGSHKNSIFFKFRLILYIFGLLIGLGLVLFPLFSDIFSQFNAESNISSMNSSYSQADSAKAKEIKEQAIKYNLKLSGQYQENVWPYNEQLSFSQNGVMSYLEIPKISIKMPIFHGTEQNALMAGIGHLEKTSLPIGGQSVHCVVSAHSGMSSMRAFDDLHKLDKGDKFTLWTLSEPYCYQVYDVEVVEPQQTESLRIAQNQDLCTLITCTPYGVNTHRLLVHGQRCEYCPDNQDVNFNPFINSRTVPLIIGSVLLIAILTVVIIVRKKKKKKNQKLPFEK